MYIRLEDHMTRTYFRLILDSAIQESKKEYEEFPENQLNQSFYNQLLDIKKEIVVENHILTEEESRKRYQLGIMAVRNFDGYLDEDWDYPKKLIDIAAGISRYPEMPEK